MNAHQIRLAAKTLGVTEWWIQDRIRCGDLPADVPFSWAYLLACVEKTRART